ncbi:MAG: class I SAM-dependent methyltransferase [Deltaproteobacteria bacterium]|nr:class I SAM-dependent methyltransferase [Deltaproteobacteria bacterium]
MKAAAPGIDDPARVEELRAILRKKGFLRAFYKEVYARYAEVLKRCPADGVAVELGSGAGFVKEVVPEITTSDYLAYSGVDLVVDATKMPFADRSVRFICMLNVFHHIPDVGAFLAEADRCLKPGGRIFMRDQHVGWLSSFFFKHLHHEPFDPKVAEWAFDSTGPLSGANGALAWIVFQRDRAKFERLFPTLSLERYSPNSPFRYWMSGGLKPWSLLPEGCFRLATGIESLSTAAHRGWSSFVDIELVKRDQRAGAGRV